MVQVLDELTIKENAFVDKGAGVGVTMNLKKRDLKKRDPFDNYSGDDIGVKLRKDALREAEVEAYMKREFTSEQRQQMARTGHAMAGGAFPIANTKDLKNAIRAIGRAKNPGKTKQHIISRARSLGATRLLPDKWVRKSFEKNIQSVAALVKSEGGEDFNTELGEMMSLDYGEGLMEAIHDACHAMKHSIESIMDDDGTPNKGVAIRASFAQFLDHVQSLAPEGDVAKIAKRAKESLMANTFKKAYTSVGQSDETTRRQEIDAKTGKLVTVDDDEKDPHDGSPMSGRSAADVGKKFKKAKRLIKTLLNLAKDDKDSKDYMDSPDCDMDDDVKKAFVGMSKTERKVYMDANPIDERAMMKRLEGLPSEVRKQLELGREAAEKLAKREETEALQNFTKRALEARLPKDVGPHLVALHKASPDDLKVVLEAVDTLAKSTRAVEDTNFIFKEFGTRRGADISGSSAYEILMQKAQDQADQGKFPTVEQAFAKLLEARDPEIRELIKRGKLEGSL